MKNQREDDAVRAVAIQLLLGRRLEVSDPAGFIVYMGSVDGSNPRRDPFWYEHTGGRTYKEEAEQIARAVLRKVGLGPLEKAKVVGGVT